ncbi:MAG TPA: hypothetical protein VMF89_18160 [Polyangiales bacterium]|nr:hypothetical protein [Polyangiales bacterium]
MMFAAGVRAQESSAGAQLSVDAPDTCISEARVRERVQQYRAGAESGVELSVRVEQREGVLGFIVLHGGEALARRQLTQLPAACDERLDSLALAIAVALSNAVASSPTIAAASGIDETAPRATSSSERTLPPRAQSSEGLPAQRQPRPTGSHSQSPPLPAQTDAAARARSSEAREPTASSKAQTSDVGDDGRLTAAALRVPRPVDARTEGMQKAPSAAEAPAPTALLDALDRGGRRPPTAAERAESSEAQTSSAPREAQTVEVWDGREKVPLTAGARTDNAARDGGRVPPTAAGMVASTSRSDARDDAGDDGSGSARGPRAGDVGIMAGARYGLELLPDLLLLFDAGIEVGLTRVVSLAAGGLVSPAQASAADGGRMRTQITGGELLLCARPTAANVMLRGCVGAAAASVGVRGEAFFVDRSARLAWAAGLMRAAVRWPADSPVAAELALGGHANLVRPRMRVLNSSEPDRVSWVLGGSLGLQLVVSLR